MHRCMTRTIIQAPSFDRKRCSPPSPLRVEPFSNYTAIFSWDDGTESTTSTVEAASLARRRTGRDRPLAVIDATARIEQNSAGDFTILAAKTYRSAGTYRVVVTIEDKDGASAFVMEEARASFSSGAAARSMRLHARR